MNVCHVSRSTIIGWLIPHASVALAQQSPAQETPQPYAVADDIGDWTVESGAEQPIESPVSNPILEDPPALDPRFPWSDTDTIQHARANYYSYPAYSYDTSPTWGYHPEFATYPFTSPVGYFAPNGYGLFDMVGNVSEWCNDWYVGAYYTNSPGSNPTGPDSGDYCVLRGGDWGIDAYYCRSATRPRYWPDDSDEFDGFRCVLGTR